MELTNIKRVYFIGIGGIGMSALARYFAKRGCLVAGYDRTATPLTHSLEAEGIQVSYVDAADAVLPSFRSPDPSLLVVYTPAIPSDSGILNYFRNAGFDLKKRSAVLGIISEGMFTIAVAGTHGKTTTSTLIAHLLTASGYGCTAFLGGISSNYNVNVLFGNNDVVVVEADEYDRSFLTLHPDIAVVTATDADHLDIYGSEASVKESFALFTRQLKEGGKLIERKGLDLGSGITYAAAENADVSAQNIRVLNGTFLFDFVSSDGIIADLEMPLPGVHNVENAVAAVRVALSLGLNPEEVRKALGSFRGVKRRFEYLVKSEEVVYIDDYAHHPEELRACLKAARMLYPDRKITMLFQPHLYSRTRDFAEGFSEVLSDVDDLVLLDIYPARELPIDGVSSRMIYEKVRSREKTLCSLEEALEVVKKKRPELLITAGAGDIDTLVEPIKKLLLDA